MSTVSSKYSNLIHDPTMPMICKPFRVSEMQPKLKVTIPAALHPPCGQAVAAKQSNYGAGRSGFNLGISEGGFHPRAKKLPSE